MSTSYSVTDADTFTLAHARKIAAKVATDLLRFQTLYNGVPSNAAIDSYEKEITEYLKHDVVERVEYGFKRNNKWTEAAVRYKALPGGTLVTDDDPGKIRPRLDIAGASFTSFLLYNAKWFAMTEADRAAIEHACPFKRVSGTSPLLEVGSWADDLNYVAGGRGLGRATVRR